MRVKGGTVTRRRHKKIIKAAKGFLHGRSKLFGQANQAVMKSGVNAYTGRKLKKRQFRSLWVVRLNTALKQHGLRYNQFIAKKNKDLVLLNRKVLSEIAVNHPETFEVLVKEISSGKAKVAAKTPSKTASKEPAPKDKADQKKEPAAASK